MALDLHAHNALLARLEPGVIENALVLANGGPTDLLSGDAIRTIAQALVTEAERYQDHRLRFMHPSILCANGEYFDFLAPESFSWDINVLAAGLRAARFTSQTRTPGTYSIAQHSVLASYAVAPGFEFEALMHDAHEGIYGDMATPFKVLLPDYKEHEDRGEAAMRKVYLLPPTMTREVKTVDTLMLATEKRDIMPDPDKPWAMLDGIVPLAEPIAVWDVEYAREAFLARFKELWPAHATKVLTAQA